MGNTSFKTKLNEIDSNVPSSITADIGAILFGLIITGMGYLITDMGNKSVGIFVIILGLLGVGTGFITFISSSPKMKILQAIDNFLLAIILLVFAAMDTGIGLFASPLVSLAIAGFTIWSGWDYLKEYRILTK